MSRTALIDTHIQDENPDQISLGVRVVTDRRAAATILTLPDGSMLLVGIDSYKGLPRVKVFSHKTLDLMSLDRNTVPDMSGPGLVEMLVGRHEILSVLNDLDGEPLHATSTRPAFEPQSADPRDLPVLCVREAALTASDDVHEPGLERGLDILPVLVELKREQMVETAESRYNTFDGNPIFRPFLHVLYSAQGAAERGGQGFWSRETGWPVWMAQLCFPVKAYRLRRLPSIWTPARTLLSAWLQRRW